MSCKDAMAALVHVVEQGGAIPDEQREHIKHCARCRELLESADQFQSTIEEPPMREPAVDEQRLASEVRGVRMRDRVRRSSVAAIIAFMTVSVLTIVFGRIKEADAAVLLGVAGFAVAITVMVVAAVHVLFGSLRDRQGNRIYKRLGPGRMLSGVCLGLSEATGVPVMLLRLAFIALSFGEGIGIVLYILLELAMPVHPDDRQHLLRFKLRRMWQRRFAHADDDAG